MKNLEASETVAGANQPEVRTKWDILLDEDGEKRISWDDVAEEPMAVGEETNVEEEVSAEGEPLEERIEQAEYDETLYSSKNEYLAAQRAALTREESEQPIAMTAQDINRQLFAEINHNSDDVAGQNLDATQEVLDGDGDEESGKREEVEIPGEKWFENIIGLLDATMSPVQQLVEMNRGSRTGEEMAGVLVARVREMLEESSVQLAELQTGRNLGRYEAVSAAYIKQMTEQYNYAMQLLDTLRNNAMSKPLPQQLLGGIISNIQQVENNLKMVSDLVSFNPQPMVAAEKLASDEAELRQVYGIE